MTENQSPKKPSIHAGHRERLRKQYLEFGADALHDHQLLELLLFYALPRRDTNPLAHALLTSFGSLNGVLNASTEELMQVGGLSENTAVLLSLTTQLHRRMALEQNARVSFPSMEDAAEYLEPYFRHKHQEQVYLLSANQRNELLGCDLLANGGDHSVSIEPRSLAELALRHHASWVILAHSHPSGFAIPSQEDIAATRQCRDILQSLGITLRDHLIFADDDYLSMKQSKMF